MVFPAPAAVHTVDHGQSGAGGPVPAGQLGGTLTVVQTADGPDVQFNAPGEEVVPLQCLTLHILPGRTSWCVSSTTRNAVSGVALSEQLRAGFAVRASDEVG